jgi:hypothetical protein
MERVQRELSLDATRCITEDSHLERQRTLENDQGISGVRCPVVTARLTLVRTGAKLPCLAYFLK